MTPPIDQMIAYIEGEMAKYATPASYMDKGYRVLEQARRQALKIKERCDADVTAARYHIPDFNAHGTSETYNR